MEDHLLNEREHLFLLLLVLLLILGVVIMVRLGDLAVWWGEGDGLHLQGRKSESW